MPVRDQEKMQQRVNDAAADYDQRLPCLGDQDTAQLKVLQGSIEILNMLKVVSDIPAQRIAMAVTSAGVNNFDEQSIKVINCHRVPRTGTLSLLD